MLDEDALFKQLCGVKIEVKKPKVFTPGDPDMFLAGKTFVLTGTLKDYTRAEAHDLIENAGGTFSGSVTYNTDYLVLASDGSAHTKKVNDAKKKNVNVISEKEFYKILSNEQKV